MAAPTFVAASTGSTDPGGAWSHTCMAPGAAGRLIIVHIVSDGNSIAWISDIGDTPAGTNITSLTGVSDQWTRLRSTAPAGFQIGGGVAFHNVYVGRSTGTTAPTISGGNSSTDDLYFRAYEFADASSSTVVSEVIENAAVDYDPDGTAGTPLQETGVSGTINDCIVTTNGPDRLALNFVGINDDNTITAFTGETGGDWALAVAVFATATGTDASLTLMSAAMPSAGTINGGTTTNPDAADGWGVTGFAIIGTTTAGFAPPFRPRRRCSHCR